MSNEIYDNLVKEAIDAIKKGDLDALKSVLESELLDFSEENMPTEKLIVLAARNGQKEIIEHLITPLSMYKMFEYAGWALHGYTLSGNFESFKELLDRFIPYMKKNEKFINIVNAIDVCIRYKYVEMARKIIKMFSMQPYSEISNYSNYTNIHSRFACECINYNCIALLDECFEIAVHAKEKLDFEDALLIAKALKRDEIVKKLEIWKEKYPYQCDNNKNFAKYSPYLNIPAVLQIGC